MLWYCFSFRCQCFGHEACGILSRWPGIKQTPPALEGEVLTTGPPSKSPGVAFESLTLSTPPESQKPLDEDLLSEWKLLWPQGRISHTDFSNYLGDFLIQNRGGKNSNKTRGKSGREVHLQVKMSRDPERRRWEDLSVFPLSPLQ